MNTTENNKLIAEFMGWERNNIGKWIVPDDLAQDYLFADLRFDSDLIFHSDWNWLMEVVEKIENLGHGFTIYRKSAQINEIHLGITHTRKETKIEAVYNACIDFIKWYNENNN